MLVAYATQMFTLSICKPLPFNENVKKEVLPVGIWHTDSWNGIKVEWKELEEKQEQEISRQIYDFFGIAKRNFE